MTEFSKLAWQKQLRGHFLSPTEYLVLSTIATYSDARGQGAHPGWARLGADTGLDQRTIKRAVKVLLAGRYLKQTAEGGNQHAKGMANEYAILPAAEAAGAPGPTTTAAEGVHPMTPLANGESDTGRGASGAPRGTSDVAEGVHPMTPHQITTSGPIIIPPSSKSGSVSTDHEVPTSSAASTSSNWSLLQDDCLLFEEWLEENVGNVDASEFTTAVGMWESGQHPKAIANTIRKQRRAS